MFRFSLKPFQRTLICISLDSDESTEMMKVVKAAIEARFTFCKKVLSRFISKFSHSDSSECLFFEKSYYSQIWIKVQKLSILVRVFSVIFFNVEKKSFEIRSSEFLHQVYFAFPTFQDQKIIYLFKMGGRGVNSGKEPYLSRPRSRNRRLSKSGNLPVQKVERSQHNESQFNVCIVEHIFVFC